MPLRPKTKRDQFLGRPALLAAMLVTLGCPTLAQVAGPHAQPPEFNLQPKTKVFFAYGDSRFTDPAACELSDQTYRTALVEKMAHAPEKPDFLLMTGDTVLAGDNEHDWEIFDSETKPLKDAKIPIFPVLGNHDVKGTSGQSNFVEHFDELKSHAQLKSYGWYSIDYANAEFLMLDSQSAYDEHSAQGDWLRKRLKSVPEELAFLFIVLHHPVVTHTSRIPFLRRCNGRYSRPALGHDVEDAEQRLKVLLEQFCKTHLGVRVIVVSGHNHNYERYLVNGITYIVTGGGGATPYRINRHRTDFYNESGPTYHYCQFALQENVLVGSMYKIAFKDGTPKLERKDLFRLQSPGARK